MKKIAFIGTHGTGKTTIGYELVSALKKLGIKVEFLREIANEAKKVGFNLNKGTTKDSQKWILHTQIAKELECENLEDVEYCIGDRSAIDNYIYYIKQFGADNILDLMVNEHMKTYDFLFKMPINSKYLKEDGVRSIDPVFQKEIDDLLYSELEERKTTFHKYESLEKTLKIILG